MKTQRCLRTKFTENIRLAALLKTGRLLLVKVIKVISQECVKVGWCENKYRPRTDKLTLRNMIIAEEVRTDYKSQTGINEVEYLSK